MRYLAFIACLSFTACSPDDLSVNDIGGKWNMVGVRINGQDAAPQLNPTGERWIRFDEEIFTSGEGAQVQNGGTFTLDPVTGKLSLDSDAGPGDDSSWSLTLASDTLRMRGIGTERQEKGGIFLPLND